MSVQRGPYVGSPAHQQPVPFSYQEGLPYAAYRLVHLLDLFKTVVGFGLRNREMNLGFDAYVLILCLSLFPNNMIGLRTK